MQETMEPLLALEKVFFETADGSDTWCETIEQMVTTPAKSLDGIRAKARVACSLRIGDIDEEIGPITTLNLPNSILRDLIRLYDPHLET